MAVADEQRRHVEMVVVEHDAGGAPPTRSISPGDGVGESFGSRADSRSSRS